MSTWHGGFQNRGTPKSSNFIGISIINHPFWGIPIFGNTHMMMSDVKGRCPHGRFPHIAPPPYAWVHTCRHHSDRAKRIQKVTSNLTKSPPSFSEFHDEFHIGLRCWPFQQGFFTWQIMDIHVSSGLWCLCDVTISCPLSSTCKEQTGLEDLQELNNQNWKVHQATALQIWKLRMKEKYNDQGKRINNLTYSITYIITYSIKILTIDSVVGLQWPSPSLHFQGSPPQEQVHPLQEDQLPLHQGSFA